MSIVGSLFRTVAPALVDNLEAQGLFRSSTRIAPSLVPEMFIGREGITNLGEAGIADTGTAMKLLDDAERDWFRLPAEEWMKKYPDQAVAYDPVANKAMVEISDKNVDLRKGINLNKLPDNDIYAFDEIFEADMLKKAYPDLEDMTVRFQDNPASPALASFSPEQNAVIFNRRHPEWKNTDPVGVALHEIQHFVQGKELFTQGESFRSLLGQNDAFQQAKGSLDQLIKQSPGAGLRFAKENGFTTEEVADALGSLIANDGLSANKALLRELKDKQKVEKFMSRAQNYPAIDAILQTKNAASKEYNKSVSDYMRVAGEVFARQTQERGGMSVAQRLEFPAMRAIETNPENMAAGVTIDNMTASRAQAAQAAQSNMADPFQMQVPQSTIPGI